MAAKMAGCLSFSLSLSSSLSFSLSLPLPLSLSACPVSSAATGVTTERGLDSARTGVEDT